MNILLLTNHLNIGGVSSYALTLAMGLRERGHKVFIASGGGELSGRLAQEGIGYLEVPLKTKAEINPKIIYSMFKLADLARQEKIEIIHANTRVTQVLAALLKRRCRLPYISTCHGYFKRRLLRRVFPCWGSRVIAISEPVKRHLIDDFVVNEKMIRVVYNGIDLKRFNPVSEEERKAAKLSLGLGERPVIGIIARLSDVKGHIYLIKAMEKVLLVFPRAQLLIVGSGRMLAELQGLVNKLEIGRSVKFIASVDDTRRVLSAMDLFVMPSLKEGLGLGVMEAMACGLCVIGSYVGGLIDLIQQGHSGVLVPPKNEQRLAQAICELLADDEKRMVFGTNARIFIAGRFSQEKMAEETQRVYEECLSADS
ncbi:MAG: glycosyltransferase family 4 protein [Candidatus Omnitrophica bacterium]|nr:glycosyltransferase family 4 protein [Candidatus Omnitrophota bacterium]MDD5512925.1 glycosyltransferase family 4 protein [Candidatus Omnitrophota bacterium]